MLFCRQETTTAITDICGRLIAFLGLLVTFCTNRWYFWQGCFGSSGSRLRITIFGCRPERQLWWVHIGWRRNGKSQPKGISIRFCLLPRCFAVFSSEEFPKYGLFLCSSWIFIVCRWVFPNSSAFYSRTYFLKLKNIVMAYFSSYYPDIEAARF